MTAPYPRAELSPPTRTRPSGGAPVHASPADLEAWIDDRPARDKLEAVAVLIEALRSMNGSLVEYPILTGLTEVLIERSAPVLIKIDLQLRQMPVPLGHKSRMLANAYAELSWELAAALLRLVDDGLEQRRIGGRDAAPHLRRALVVLAGRFLHFWRLYQPLPADMWLQTYRILEVAEAFGVAGEPATGAERLGGQILSPDSVEHLIARIAVMGSAGVYALHHGEVNVLARWLESVPVPCLTEVPAGADESSPLLRLTLHQDHAPSLVTGHPNPGAEYRLVDLSPVLDAIRSGPAAQAHAGNWHPVTGGLDRRLLNLWVVPPTRRFSREPADVEPIITVTGLADIHALVRADYRHQRKLEIGELSGLPGGGGSSLPVGDPRHVPAALSLGIGDPDEGEQLSLHVGGSSRDSDEARFLSDQNLDRLGAAWNDALRGINPRIDDTPQPRAVRLLQPTAGRLRNLGAGGLNLVLKSPAQKVYSGDLIAVRATRKGRVVWQLGAIRWLRYDGPEDVTVGIEYLAPGCTPTEVHLIRSNTPVGNPKPGLFFRPHGKSGAGALAFSPAAFTTGNQVSFRIAGEQHVVKLESVRPESHTFSRADFPMPASPSS